MFSNSLLATHLFFTSSLNAAWLFLWASRPSRREMTAVLALGLLLLVSLGAGGSAYERVMLVGAYLGAAALLTNGFYLAFLDRSLARMKLLFEMLLGPLSILILILALTISGQINPVYDRYLYMLDGSFGFQPGFLAARILLSHTWLRIASEIAYVNLPLAVALIYLLLRAKSSDLSTELFRTVVGVGILGYLAYLILPAVGSAVAFTDFFPFREQNFDQTWVKPIVLELSPRNLMPSLHASWAITLWRGSHHVSKYIRGIVASYLFFLLFETLSCHYLADLAAAAPFTLAVQGVLASVGPRGTPRAWIPALVGLLLFAGWVLLVRFGLEIALLTPVVPWSFLIGTVLVCAWVGRSRPASSPGLPS